MRKALLALALSGCFSAAGSHVPVAGHGSLREVGVVVDLSLFMVALRYAVLPR